MKTRQQEISRRCAPPCSDMCCVQCLKRGRRDAVKQAGSEVDTRCVPHHQVLTLEWRVVWVDSDGAGKQEVTVRTLPPTAHTYAHGGCVMLAVQSAGTTKLPSGSWPCALSSVVGPCRCIACTRENRSLS